MWWTLVIAICSSGLLCVGATNCTTADLDYTFGRCVSGHRSGMVIPRLSCAIVVFSWKGKNCTNRPPQPLKDLLCDVNCPSGTFLGVDLNSTKPLCMDCPANTYSFGGKLRLSDKDLNWNELPLSSQTNLHYKDGTPLPAHSAIDQDEIVMERADSFAVKPDNSAIQTNMALAQKDTWNLFEFRLIQKMPEDGNVSFVYSKATKPMDNENNGIFEFMINGELVLRDENLTSIDKAKKRFRLHKGYNELSWRYSFTTVAEYSDLYAEISVIVQ